ncbi:serine/threonine-protein phosphatase 7 long form homolog [Apium graveolens]|uniref:serine/threonine-protein phosphatase 7 long form homolog n=1 Tax=Apium graveolens TaxID=4045 RepID=UPI003D7AF93C
MRQFSIIQDIPLDVEFSKALHDINLQGKQSNIWGFRHHEHILYWSHRQELVIRVGANVSNGVVEGYDTWYTYITRRFHTRIGGSHFYSIDLLDHMDAIARGEIDGTNEDIAFLCAHGKNVVKGAFSHGVFQDFPVEDRREKENLKRLKPKKVYHKGGRGGTNAPCNR